ncbi:UDP-2,3-diacylglucosamine diphosphatase LpxI [Asticcacaulis sp. EMRT-3]|uniref:LpxI family protein n=1 Tax=Asticcacaulis sp. EMRT-3 TaxID=3040349 RepID=UPI0024AEDA86|nr:UDP-2,3-diacylglucosamine diphosphatase LpxI [Asticcacaulis sp. EMRT-3]MDI7774836.1 UDP-2,3-diacylglucosamine diphosphatase LpxI [Asticcacaulis sp. EMRT-3]
MTSATKLALISGGGALPMEVAAHLRATGRPYTVIRIAGLSDAALDDHPGHTLGLGEFARLFEILQSEQAHSVTMCGYVQRPDFNRLERDHGGARVLPGIQSAGRGGDDSLLRQVASVIAAQGYQIEGAHEANPDLLIGAGLQTGPELSPDAMEDALEALRIAAAIGQLDIGQAVVVAGRITLAVEAQEGTQSLLQRVAGLPATLRGTPDNRKGVLAKLAKPIQDLRLDMPTIGVATVDDVAAAGLCGIVARAHHLLIVDKRAVFARAAEKGIFIHGYEDL